MSGTQITASTLVNKIVYRTDLNSLKKARNDMKKLQQEFSKSNNQVAKVKQQADKQIHQAQIKQQRDIDKQQKQTAKQQAADTKAKQNEQKKLAAAQSRAAKIQMQQQAKTAKISENARLAERKALFDIGRLQGLNGTERFQAIKHAQGLIDSYKNQTITLRDLNQQLSQYLTTQRSIARNNSKQAKQSGKGKNLAHLVGLHAMHLQSSQLISCWDQPQPHSWGSRRIKSSLEHWLGLLRETRAGR
ncbi:hypothetical protein ACJEDO_23315 [Klebsiella pneumoniae]